VAIALPADGIIVNFFPGEPGCFHSVVDRPLVGTKWWIYESSVKIEADSCFPIEHNGTGK
jgi:hypothetical protein